MRIRELEQPELQNDLVNLQNPFAETAQSQNNWDPMPETSGIAYGMLIDAFMVQAKSLGFFLNPRLFDPLLAGEIPSQLVNPALLNAICLWGAAFLNDSDLESTMLTCAVQAVSSGLANAHSAIMVLQTLQASLLLSQYFFHRARLLEARYHATCALSIVLGAEFHKIRSATAARTGLSEMTPAVTMLEEGERINAFWAVLAQNCCLSAIADPASGSSVSYDVVDVPWPLELEAYEIDSTLLPIQNCGTITKFLSNRVDQGRSTPALQAKSAILFERASLLCAQATDQTVFSAQHIGLNHSIESLKQAILATSNRTSGLSLAHTLAHAATLLLHQPFADRYDESRQCMLRSCRAIVEFGRSQDWTSAEYVDPVLGTIWSLAINVLVSEIARLKHRGSPASRNMLRQFNQAGVDVLSAMTSGAASSKMIGDRLHLLGDACNCLHLLDLTHRDAAGCGERALAACDGQLGLKR
ncbi:unnamed protein product [Mycena citricolor]|uniref:Transcription factor domain-containing protein n=1 Tax=Mycena citricolor TaxID=2018698 RepID=A0AAD2HEQ2_9AGAR|nr:unnamed protein product [Mycena citricolor]